jgi:Flp pilus assembly protein TadD
MVGQAKTWQHPNMLKTRTQSASSHTLNSDRAAGLVSRALLHLAEGDQQTAQVLYEQAIQREPLAVPPYVNLADLLRLQGDESASAAVLQAGLQVQPEAPALLQARALQLVRAGDLGAAAPLIERAQAAAPERPDLVVLLALAYDGLGQTERARAVLAAFVERHVSYRQPLQTWLSLAQRDAAAGDAAAVVEVRRAAALLAALDQVSR